MIRGTLSLRPLVRAAPVVRARLAPTVQRLALPHQLQPASAAASLRLSSAFSTSARYEKAERHISPKWKSGEVVTYGELKPITQSPSDDIILIDVREPDEVALGNIPSSVNLPLSGFEKSLAMDEGDFTKKHGFHKPEKTQQIIFYCRSGKRSATAVDLAKRAGYKAIRNYEGSYLDWQAKDAKSDD